MALRHDPYKKQGCLFMLRTLPFDISLHFPYNTIIMEGCPSG